MPEGIPGTNKLTAVASDGQRWLGVMLTAWQAYKTLREEFGGNDPDAPPEGFLTDQEAIRLLRDDSIAAEATIDERIARVRARTPPVEPTPDTPPDTPPID